ncbi:MAG: hypothetical protein Q8754_02995, partial [Sweet potato little leaf phytoplasma]|nr:hypothetical protein [Sweet potato little leaf phytoplasma]
MYNILSLGFPFLSLILSTHASFDLPLSLPIAKAAPSLSLFDQRRRSTTVARTFIRASQQPSQLGGFSFYFLLFLFFFF